MKKEDLLFEIGTEELPARQLKKLVRSLANHLSTGFKEAGLNYGEVQTFATPRRLAVLTKDLDVAQSSQRIEKRGPAMKAAFDSEGNPTLACLGFANACDATIEELEVKETDKGAWLFFSREQGGTKTQTLLPAIIQRAVKRLSTPKPMRWGNGEFEFVRPVHWIILLFGSEVVPTELFGKPSGRDTFGHRFHHPQNLSIAHPNQYNSQLSEQGFVIADFDLRKHRIREGIQAIATLEGEVMLDEALLDEVTGLVEWPIPLLGKFATEFLELPDEVVVSTIKSHQKGFPLVDQEGLLLPYFVMVSNIESREPERVIDGNQRVIGARLADARFFYQTDLKHRLDSHLIQLKKIIFQKELGTLFDKVQRISHLTGYLMEKNPFRIDQPDLDAARRAGLLCKADLTTTMVGEFPELQGIMGYYYAEHDGEVPTVALALREHYQPRFATDDLPETPLGALLSVADKIDTLVGFFSVNQAPTGDKDPYALRRAALGILRTLVEKQITVSLFELVQQSMKFYKIAPENEAGQTLLQQLSEFILERARAWYLDKAVASSVFKALQSRAHPIHDALDFHHRIEAVQHFLSLPQAQALIAANKRVSHLLRSSEAANANTFEKQPFRTQVQTNLFENDAENALFEAICQKTKAVQPLYQSSRYQEALVELATLQTPIDRFFDQVMVLTDNEVLRHNRLALLRQVKQLLSHVADIALLTA